MKAAWHLKTNLLIPVTIHGLKEVLGHSSIATTGVYLYADEEELEQVAAVMLSVLERQKIAVAEAYR